MLPKPISSGSAELELDLLPDCLAQAGFDDLLGHSPAERCPIAPIAAGSRGDVHSVSLMPSKVTHQAGRVMQQRMEKGPAVAAPVSPDSSSHPSQSDTATALHASLRIEAESCTAESKIFPVRGLGKRRAISLCVVHVLQHAD